MSDHASQLIFGHASMIPTITKIIARSEGSSASGQYTLESYYQPLAPSEDRPSSLPNILATRPRAVVYDLIDSSVVEILYPCLVIAHILGIVVNVMLSKIRYYCYTNSFIPHLFIQIAARISVYGVWKHIRWMLTPWMALQGILATALAGLSLYYLTLFPNKSNCSTISIEVRLVRLISYVFCRLSHVVYFFSARAFNLVRR